MATYTATLHTFSDEKSYYSWDKEKKFVTFEIIDSEQIKFTANSLDEAEDYIIRNYPDRCCGYGISGDNDSFLCDAVKDYYYEELGLETMEQIFAFKIKMLEKKVVA